jgi:hypothetical protein
LYLKTCVPDNNQAIVISAGATTRKRRISTFPHNTIPTRWQKLGSRKHARNEILNALERGRGGRATMLLSVLQAERSPRIRSPQSPESAALMCRLRRPRVRLTLSALRAEAVLVQSTKETPVKRQSNESVETPLHKRKAHSAQTSRINH